MLLRSSSHLHFSNQPDSASFLQRAQRTFLSSFLPSSSPNWKHRHPIGSKKYRHLLKCALPFSNQGVLYILEYHFF
eukprot:UN18098